MSVSLLQTLSQVYTLQFFFLFFFVYLFMYFCLCFANWERKNEWMILREDAGKKMFLVMFVETGSYFNKNNTNMTQTCTTAHPSCVSLSFPVFSEKERERVKERLGKEKEYNKNKNFLRLCVWPVESWPELRALRPTVGPWPTNEELAERPGNYSPKSMGWAWMPENIPSVGTPF